MWCEEASLCASPRHNHQPRPLAIGHVRIRKNHPCVLFVNHIAGVAVFGQQLAWVKRGEVGGVGGQVQAEGVAQAGDVAGDADPTE